MAKPEQITISITYFKALQEVKDCADFLLESAEGTEQYAQWEYALQCALGEVFGLEGIKRKKKD